MKNTNVVLGVLGLLATDASAMVASDAVESNDRIAAINEASLKSMESSWLKVPPVCKGRGFNADAVPQLNRQARSEVQAIYEQYQT